MSRLRLCLNAFVTFDYINRGTGLIRSELGLVFGVIDKRGLYGCGTYHDTRGHMPIIFLGILVWLIDSICHWR